MSAIKREERIGGQRLILGDCLEVMQELGPVDAVVTSPPYNCGKDYGTASDRLSDGEYRGLISAVAKHPARVLIVNVGQYVGSREARRRLPDLIEQCVGASPFDEVIWDKGPANGAAWGNYPNSPRIRAQHEQILAFGSAKMPTGNGITWAEWSALTTSIWRVSPAVDLKTHPAMMPVEIARRCVALWSDSLGLVLDPFMGSGTTLVACQKLGRQGIGVEIDPAYFDIACKRVDEAARQPDMFVQPAKAAVQEGFDL